MTIDVITYLYNKQRIKQSLNDIICQTRNATIFIIRVYI